MIATLTTPDLDLLQGTLDVLVLRALSWGPNHGYEVSRFIRHGSSESFTVTDSALYKSLHRMEERGWLESEWSTSGKGKRARFYRLTALGRRGLRAETDYWNDYVAAVGRVLRARPAQLGEA
jgi:PadR family transcriptional regulator PadR